MNILKSLIFVIIIFTVRQSALSIIVTPNIITTYPIYVSCVKRSQLTNIILSY